MPKVSDAYIEERRQEILDAAIACFARKGFHQTTMNDIGREAGLSHGVAYRYFESKEDLILATIEGSVGRSARYFEAMSEEADVLSIFEQFIGDFFQRLEAPGRDMYYKVRVQLWAEAIRNPQFKERTLAIRREGIEQIVTIIRRAQNMGQIDPDLNASAATVAIMASLDGFVVHWLAEPDTDIWQYRDVLVQMVRGLFSHRG